MRRLIALLIVGFVLAALAGCSSDGDNSNDATDVSVDEGTDTPGPDEGADDDVPGRSNLGNLEDCAEAARAFAGVVAAPFTFLSGQATDEQIAEWEDQVEELKGNVPDDLADDYQTLADAYGEFAAALDGVSLSDMLNPQTQQALQEASERLDTDEVQAAQERVQAYFESNCQS
jgi:hypothetical protein